MTRKAIHQKSVLEAEHFLEQGLSSMKLLILDTETTSADLNASVCEIAGTLYQIGEIERQTGAIASLATLLPVNDNPAEMINSIAHELTQSASGFVEEAIGQLKKMAMSSDYAVAFNAEFDAPLINQLLGEQRWLCAMRDFDWNYPNPKFTWDDERRIWVKKVRECDREKFLQSLDFAVESI